MYGQCRTAIRRKVLKRNKAAERPTGVQRLHQAPRRVLGRANRPAAAVRWLVGPRRISAVFLPAGQARARRDTKRALSRTSSWHRPRAGTAAHHGKLLAGGLGYLEAESQEFCQVSASLHGCWLGEVLEMTQSRDHPGHSFVPNCNRRFSHQQFHVKWCLLEQKKIRLLYVCF